MTAAAPQRPVVLLPQPLGALVPVQEPSPGAGTLS